MSFYGIVHEGDEDTNPFYYGQGFYQQKGQGQSWILDFTITPYIESLVEWVQDKYKSEGWTQHHEQLLEFDEDANKSSQPTISLRIAEPTSDKQKNWEVSFISTFRFTKWMVDRMTTKDRLPLSRIGIKWVGPPGSIYSPFVRKVELLGAKGPDNYFEIFVPEVTLSTDPGREVYHSDGATPSSQAASTPDRYGSGESGANRPPPPPLPAAIDSLPEALDTSHLHIIRRSLRGLTDWQGLGLELGLDFPFLDSINKDQGGDVDKCKTAMLHSWLQTGNATKHSLTAAMGVLAEDHIAASIQ